jgi:hypothetical protein
MTNEEQFLRVIFPPTHRVAGRRLRPLTLGHYLLLQRMGNPLAILNGFWDHDCEAGHAAQALFLFTRGWREALRFFEGPEFWQQLRLAWYADHGDALIQTVVGLHNHVMDAFKRPNTMAKPKGRFFAVTKLGAPYWMVTIARMVAQGRTVEQALDVRVQAALWINSTEDEENGVLDWVSAEESSIQDMVREEIRLRQEANKG